MTWWSMLRLPPCGTYISEGHTSEIARSTAATTSSNGIVSPRFSGKPACRGDEPIECRQPAEQRVHRRVATLVRTDGPRAARREDRRARGLHRRADQSAAASLRDRGGVGVAAQRELRPPEGGVGGVGWGEACVVAGQSAKGCKGTGFRVRVLRPWLRRLV